MNDEEFLKYYLCIINAHQLDPTVAEKILKYILHVLSENGRVDDG